MLFYWEALGCVAEPFLRGVVLVMMVNMLELPWTNSLSPTAGVLVMSSSCTTWCWIMLSWIVIREFSESGGLQSSRSMLMSDIVDEWTRVLTPSQI